METKSHIYGVYGGVRKVSQFKDYLRDPNIKVLLSGGQFQVVLLGFWSVLLSGGPCPPGPKVRFVQVSSYQEDVL